MSPEALQHLARLARLDLSPAQEADMLHALQQMIEWVSVLQSLPRQAEALSHIATQHHNMAADTPLAPLPTPQALRSAPQARESFFVVPKVID